MLQWTANWLTEVLTAAGAVGIFAASLAESACIPLPSEVILPVSGILVRQGTLTYGAAVGWALAGQMAGSALAYCAGRFGGRPFIQRYGKYVLLREHELEAAEGWFRRYGEITAFFTRLLPGVRTFISLPAGIARMPFWRFLLYSSLGALPWTAFLIWAGMAVGKIWQDPQWHRFFRFAELAVVVAAVALTARYVRKRYKEAREAKEAPK